ncbi:uncharacterized protein B0T15DRAFT_524384 [Chaetomium strumarium]|uniref:Uncharacterized protein n=1 Tax=Chaetomium strumarium TaxID=1170767 RepID=A0AAJ0GYG0_9PEZI|nr:hypothetical protein B0T15DRAFT_524384 [Chaetomium strumarium]
MAHKKPLRQLAAEKVRGKGANPTLMGDPSDLKAETSDAPDDSVEDNSPSSPPPSTSADSGSKGGKQGLGSGNAGVDLTVPRASLEGDPKAEGEEKGVVVGIGEGAGPIGGVRKEGSKSKL